MKKDFAIIGLSSFGKQLCMELARKGANVIALDSNEARVAAVADYVTQALCCDCTKEEVLRKLNIADVSHVILTIKDNMSAAILITVLLKEIGVKHITACAEDESTHKILLRLGAEEVVNPQELAVNNLCGMILNKRVKQFFEVTDAYSVATLAYTGDQPSESLREMDLRKKYDLNVLLIRRGGEDIVPTGADCFMPSDGVVVFGTNAAIRKMDKQIR